MSGSDHRLGATGERFTSIASLRLPHLALARVCIGVVLAWNVQCALAFLIAPGTYAPGLDLTGLAGNAAVRGLGLLFLMWNVPYAVALSHPLRHRVSLYEALAMQAIGLLGESFILLSLPAAHATARASIGRFIAFDAAGLVLLISALVFANSLAGAGVPFHGPSIRQYALPFGSRAMRFMSTRLRRR